MARTAKGSSSTATITLERGVLRVRNKNGQKPAAAKPAAPAKKNNKKSDTPRRTKENTSVSKENLAKMIAKDHHVAPGQFTQLHLAQQVQFTLVSFLVQWQAGMLAEGPGKTHAVNTADLKKALEFP